MTLTACQDTVEDCHAEEQVESNPVIGDVHTYILLHTRSLPQTLPPHPLLSLQDGELTHDEVLQSYDEFMSDYFVDEDDDDDDVVDEWHDEL